MKRELTDEQRRVRAEELTDRLWEAKQAAFGTDNERAATEAFNQAVADNWEDLGGTVRYRDGRWQKYLKSEGWVNA